MKGEIIFDNTLTIVISHYCIFTEALPRLIPRGFRLLSSLPRLRFSSHRGEFAAMTFGKDEVLPRTNGPIVSSGTVELSVWLSGRKDFHTALTLIIHAPLSY